MSTNTKQVYVVSQLEFFSGGNSSRILCAFTKEEAARKYIVDKEHKRKEHVLHYGYNGTTIHYGYEAVELQEEK